LRSADTVLLVVADGMGGHPKGEEAAQLVVDTCMNHFMRVQKPLVEPNAFLQTICLQSHEAILRFGLDQFPVIDPRTTIVMALIQEGVAYWGHVGDSRLYLLRAGEAHERTRDHSYVEELLQRGSISNEDVSRHPFRNYVTRCLGGVGTDPVLSVREKPMVLQQQDILLLCSDGLWGPLGDERLAAAFDSDEPLDELLQRTAQLAADEASPSSDNVTAVALRWLVKGIEPAAIDEEEDLPPEERKLRQAVSNLSSALDSFRNRKEPEETS
jgi:serine/threonine protein phosphatase PrpC